MSNLLKILRKLCWILLAIVILVIVTIPPLLYFFYRQYIYVDTSSVPNEGSAVMVLGAGVSGTDTPSSALQDRLNVAATLYKEGKVSAILVSGSREAQFYDEPKAMESALIKAGVPKEIIIQDSSGDRTFDSCFRAKNTFQFDKLLIVSQGFHLPRALFLCRSQGIDATGVYAVGGFSTYYSRWYTLREVLAMYLAVWDVVTN